MSNQILQKGHCAYTAACVNVHAPHSVVKGTNLVVCSAHRHAMEVTTAEGALDTQFSSTVFHSPRSRRRNSWLMGGV